MICKFTDKLELISLIDPAFVEEAVYPDLSRNKRHLLWRKWRKAAVIAAAALAVMLIGVGFYPQIRTLADQFLNSATVFDDGSRTEGQMEIVPINDISASDLQKEFAALDEVEALLGIQLLQSPLASQTLYPCIHIQSWFDGQEIEIQSFAYYLYHCRTTPRQPNDVGNPVYTQFDQNDGYIISYKAGFLCKGDNKGSQHSYENAQLVEKYTTPNGLHATFFLFGEGYNAVMYHNNIRYEFNMTACNGHGDLSEFKAFLNTLSDR